MARYEFKMPGLHKVSAEAAGRVCDYLANTPEGLTPQRLVDVSRDVNAPLHNEFEWDDSIAGEKYREQQAQKLIQHLVIVQSSIQTERQVKLEKIEKDRNFVSTGEQDTKYITLATALSEDKWRANLLDAARRDMQAFIAKYRRLKELTKVIDDMNDFLSA